MSNAPPIRYVLCRPQGGINDMLSQIDRCCRYGQRFGRVVIVDTAYKWSQSLGDRLSRYMVSKVPQLHLNLVHTEAEMNAFSVFPHSLQGKLMSYRGYWNAADKSMYEAPEGKGSKISFDFERDYAEDMLVHHSYRGISDNTPMANYIRFHDTLVDDLEARLLKIGGPFAAAHVRYTDMKTDYKAALDYLESRNFPRLFLATDSAFVLETFRATLGADHVISFAHKLSDTDSGLHTQPEASMQARIIRNADAFLDLLTLSFAEVLVLPRTVDGQGISGYSGFGRLAENLRNNPAVLRALLGRHNLPYQPAPKLTPQ